MAVIFPISLLFGLKSDLAGLGAVDKQLEQMGMRMRLTGRDLMRLGGAMDQFFSNILTKMGGVLKGSMMWEAGLEDISWALEDVGYVIGDVLAPLLDIITGLIESFADALERSPLLQWLVIIALVGVIIGKVMGMLIKFTGAVNIFFGTIITAHKGNLNFLQSLKALMIGFTEGQGAAFKYIKSTSNLGKTAVKSGKGASKGFMDWIKAMGGAKSILKSLLKYSLLLAGAGLMAALGFVAFTQLGEPLMELFESLGDVLAPILDPLADIITGFADWAEENPDLARGLIVAFAALAGALVILWKFGFLSKIAESAVAALSGGLTKLTTPTQAVSSNAWQATLANAALVASIALLITALTYFFVSLLSMGVGIWDAVGALAAVLGAVLAFMIGLTLVVKILGDVQGSIWMGIAAMAAMVGICILLAWAMTELLKPLMAMPGGIANLYLFAGALIMLMGALAVIAIVLGTFGAIALLGAAIMFILATAALLLGTAMLLAGMGIQMAAQGIVLLVGNLGGIITLVPAVFALAAGIMLLGAAGLSAFAGLVALAMGVLILTAALMALMIPLGIVRTLGGESAVVETLRHLPFLEEGGIITGGGLAVVHEGEEVRPAEAVKRRKEEAMAPPLVVNINAPIGSREIAQAFADDIEKILDRRYKRSR